MHNLDTKRSIEKLLTTSLINLREASHSLGLDEFLLKTVEILMQIERDEYLSSLKSQSVYDKSNGFYNRNFKSLLQSHLRINVPRTRSGNFSPATIELIQANNSQVQDFVLSLYKKGMTSRDISDLLSEFFGEKVSKSSISNLAKSFHEIRSSWNNSMLESEYLVIYCDAIYITVRRGDSYAKEAVFISYGVRKDLKRELLILESSPIESANIWDEYLSGLKSRGVKKIKLIVADGLAGFENSVMKNFPDSKLQKCVVHKMRNVTKHVSPKHKSEMNQDLKNIFDNFDKEATKENTYKKTQEFCLKWKDKYPNINRYFKKEDFDYYLTYIQFDHRIRRSIYTTNSIESINAKIKKATRNKLSFENPQYLLDYLFVVIQEYQNNKWMVFPVSLFKFL